MTRSSSANLARSAGESASSDARGGTSSTIVLSRATLKDSSFPVTPSNASTEKFANTLTSPMRAEERHRPETVSRFGGFLPVGALRGGGGHDHDHQVERVAGGELARGGDDVLVESLRCLVVEQAYPRGNVEVHGVAFRMEVDDGAARVRSVETIRRVRAGVGVEVEVRRSTLGMAREENCGQPGDVAMRLVTE